MSVVSIIITGAIVLLLIALCVLIADLGDRGPLHYLAASLILVAVVFLAALLSITLRMQS